MVAEVTSAWDAIGLTVVAAAAIYAVLFVIAAALMLVEETLIKLFGGHD